MTAQTNFKPHGMHLIAGTWVSGAETFENTPVSGPADQFSAGTEAEVARACEAAEDAFWSYSAITRDRRAGFLRAIAREIEARADAVTDIAMRETGLPEARLQGERGRTTGQLRLFADHIEQGDYLDRRHDPVLPDRQPLPRPDLRMMQRPVGPVAVFGASNFPLAFSVAGGDTAAALAAGCPVIVKGHPAHPGTSEIVAEAILAALGSQDIEPGVFSLIHDAGIAVGTALVQHPVIQAVGFTGALRGGRALFDLCARRPDPIPFFGELGSVNPMFFLPNALHNRSTEIGAGWARSLSIGAGQFCTNPGIAVVMNGQDTASFVGAVRSSLEETPEQMMLTDGIASEFRIGRQAVADAPGLDTTLSGRCEGRTVTPALFETTAEAWLTNPLLSEEVFGPLGIVVHAEDSAQMLSIAKALKGQLTCTLHLDDDDLALAKLLMPVLERRAGRILANGFPTGVEVADAMVHGGPYPASTNFGATSVGTLSIRRFLRPVCYQSLPEELLPKDLVTHRLPT